MQDLTPYLLPAIISAIVGFIVAYYGSRGAEARLREKYERELSPQKLARQVFLSQRSKCVPFATLKAHFGGIAEDHLRRVLLAAGALRFKAADGSEEWGLISRNKSRLAKAEALFPIDEMVSSENGERANTGSETEDWTTIETADDQSLWDEPTPSEAMPKLKMTTAPSLAPKKKSLANRGKDIGVSLRRKAPDDAGAKGDRLIGEMKN
ncbi:MAG: hypothetical protein AAFY73_02805 [Pseudomonadota bacterium]